MRNNFTLTYLLFVVVQMLLSNFFHFTPYLVLTILPAMVFCIPTKTGPVWTMIIAFLTGFAVDYFAEGTLGINALSLVPVALLRRPVIELICGSEPFERKESVTIRKYGFPRISLAIIIVQFVFLSIYVTADCAGTRPFWFIAARVLLSVLISYLVSMAIVNLLTDDDRR